MQYFALLQSLSMPSVNSQAHMNVGNHLTVGSHLSGLSVTARDTVMCTADSAVPSSTVTSTSAVSVSSQPSIHSLAINVHEYLSSQPSGACWHLVLFVKCSVLHFLGGDIFSGGFDQRS